MKKNKLDKKAYILIFIVLFVGLTLRAVLFAAPGMKLDTTHWQNEAGHYYLHKYDSYAFYNNALSYIEGKRSMLELNFLERNMVILWKILPSMDRMYIVSFISLFYFSLSAAALFLLINRFVKDILLSFLGALFFAVNLQFLKNSFFAFLDTNTLNHFFIICIVFCAVLLIENLRNKANKYYIFENVALIVILIYIFSITWNGWFSILLILAGGVMLWAALNKLWLTLLSGIGIFSMVGFSYRRYLLKYLHIVDGFTIMSETKYTSSWVLLVGYAFVLIMAIAVLVRNRKKLEYVLISFWSIGTVLAAVAAYRFTYFVVIPSILVTCIYIKQRWPQNDKHILEIGLLNIYAITVFFLVLFSTSLPAVDDDIVQAADFIRDRTPRDTQIFSWFDYGILWESLGRRKAMYRSVEPGYRETMLQVAAFLSNDERRLDVFMPSNAVFVVASRDLKIMEVLSKRFDSGFFYYYEGSNIVKALNCELESYHCIYQGIGKYKNISILRRV